MVTQQHGGQEVSSAIAIITPTLTTLTVEMRIRPCLLLLHLLLPPLIILYTPLPRLLPLQILPASLGVGFEPQRLCELALFLESGEFLGCYFLLLVVGYEVTAVFGG